MISLMRALLTCLLALVLASPAFADDWQVYGNARFGYDAAIPPGFVWGPESDNGDGIAFRADATRLAVWGGTITSEDFEAEADAAKQAAAGDGWSLTYESSTPSWASFSGKSGARILYTRMVALCDGMSYAAFQLVYSQIDRTRIDPLIDRMVDGLKPAVPC